MEGGREYVKPEGREEGREGDDRARHYLELTLVWLALQVRQLVERRSLPHHHHQALLLPDLPLL